MVETNKRDFLETIDRFYQKQAGERILFPERDKESVKKPSENKQNDESQSPKIPK